MAQLLAQYEVRDSLYRILIFCVWVSFLQLIWFPLTASTACWETTSENTKWMGKLLCLWSGYIVFFVSYFLYFTHDN